MGKMLKNYTLLRSQKNRVYELLRQEGLEPADFSWVKEEIAGSMVVSRLSYRDGTYYFQFSSHEVNAWCTACPGQFRGLDYEHPKSWDEQEGVFKKWVQCLKREIAAPDPWGELARYKVAFRTEPNGDAVNETISGAEAEQIIQGLARLTDAIERELKLTEDEVAMVGAKLDYLAEAAKRQKSRDWVYTALGMFATIAATLALPEATAATLWRLFQTEMGPFVHLVTAPNPTTAPKARIMPVDPPAGQPAQQEQKRRLFFF
jgi:hypothetical protein